MILNEGAKIHVSVICTWRLFFIWFWWVWFFSINSLWKPFFFWEMQCFYVL